MNIYAENPSSLSFPKDLARKELVRLKHIDPNFQYDNEELWFQELKLKKFYGIYLFDEVQVLYDEDKYRESCKNILKQILTVGKEGGALGVISGSSSNLCSLIYCKSPSSKGYPNLNDRVYTLTYLPPLRENKEI